MTSPPLTRDFRTFWLGQSVSLVGSQVSALALPLTAVVLLGAGAREMGFLQASRFLPFLLLALPAGVLVDRMARKPLLVAADLGRAALLAVVPLSTLAGVLRLETLYLVSFAAGALTVVFEVAYLTVAPWLVAPASLIKANARLMTSQAFAEVSGPPLAGQLIQALGAPVAIAIDALSFAVGAAAILGIRTREPRPRSGPPRPFLAEVRIGAKAAFADPYVRAIGCMAATYNLIETAILTLLILYALELGFSPAALGLILGCGAIGALAGSLHADDIGDRIGVGATIVIAMIVETSAFIPIALLPDASFGSGALFAAALLLNGWGTCVSTVHSMSVRQRVTPPQVLGRMNSFYRLLVTGTVPLGALIAGALGESLGLTGTIRSMAMALPLSLLWIVLSPLPRLRRLPEISEKVEELR